MSKYKIPKWIEEGPMDLEYKTLKMMARVKHLRQSLIRGGLMKVLIEVDDTLDYLYRYDAQQVTRVKPHEYEVMGLQWEDLEMVFTTEEELETNSNLLVLNSNDQMLFDKSVLKAKANEEVSLLLNHTGKIGKEFMGHNFVLLKNNVDVDDFAQAAMLAKENEYIPDGDDTIAYTSMIGGGESDQISFTVNNPGTYVFLCTFPGHYQIMRGEFIVE